MVEKTKGRSRFENPAAPQLHAILGIFRMGVEHLPADFTNHEACRQPPPGEDPPANAR
jgi:hypothetical protein